MSEANRSLTGPATPTKLPHITLRGNSYQRGCQYGRDFREYLGRFYDWFIGRDPKEVLTREYRTVLEGMEEVTSRQMPQLLEELKGWSDGSGLEYNRCRLLGFHNEIKSVLRPGCSNVIVTRGPDGPWLAKNTDLFENERSWMVMVTCNCDDAFSHAGVNYLGLPFGGTVNSAGLVIGGSSLPADPPAEPKGFPNLNHYMTLTQSTVAGCWDAIRELGHLGKGAHYALLDATGDAAAIELGGGASHLRQPDPTGLLVVTNHSPTGRVPAPKHIDEHLRVYLENSQARYDRLMALFAGISPENRTVASGRAALADHEGRWTVCEHVPGGFHTIYGHVARPGKKSSELHLCWGYPCQGRFDEYRLFTEKECVDGNA